MRILLMIAILIPQIASAGVFMCVDPVTGKKSFTDRACPTKDSGKKVKVEQGNFGDSGYRQERTGGERAWHSQRDTAVSGRANYGDTVTAERVPAETTDIPIEQVSS